MQKFIVLLKKEIRELLTLRLVLPVIAMAIIFSFIGNLMASEQEKADEAISLALIDNDKSVITEQIKTSISENDFNIVNLENVSTEEAKQKAQDQNLSLLLVIPENFETDLTELKKPQIQVYNLVKSFSIFATMKSSKFKMLSSVINESLSNQFLATRITDEDISSLKQPITFNDYVVIKDREANVPLEAVTTFISSQGAFVPMIVFLVIVIAAQMVATSIATEKENKTFETLLSSPINRKTIVIAKIMASAIVAGIFSLIYVFGFKSYMQGFTGGMNLADDSAMQNALEQLGITMSPTAYVFLGISLFASILLALAIAMLLGILAEDVKAVQAVITPLMILIMIPYFISMFFDVDNLSPALKYLYYAIPFTHTFMAMSNLMWQDYMLVVYGIIYQLFCFAIFVYILSRIFSSDLALTIKLNFSKKK